MSLEDATFHLLKDNAGVAARVGARIYRVGSVPSSVTATQDYLSYQRVSTQRAEHQTAADLIADARIQHNCFSPTPKGAKAVADAVRAAWANTSGPIGATGKKTTVHAARVRDESHDFELPHDGGQVGKHRYVVDVLVWYTE